MQNKDEKKFTRKQGAMLILSLCLVGAAAFTTYYTMEKAQREKEEEQQLVDLNEEAEAREETAAEAANADKAEADLPKEETEKLATEMDVDPATLVDQETQDASGETEAAAASAQVEQNIQPSVAYEDTTPLTWPVAGTVLMDYSMDATVYFATLDQYKYNPALIISSEVGNQVVASAKGIVDSIEVNEETGTTLTLNLGNSYELVYGQLKEVAVSEGDVVETGALLGYVSEPTKYYCEEGGNLYFQMKKDKVPVDPFLYLE